MSRSVSSSWCCLSQPCLSFCSHHWWLNWLKEAGWSGPEQSVAKGRAETQTWALWLPTVWCPSHVRPHPPSFLEKCHWRVHSFALLKRKLWVKLNIENICRRVLFCLGRTGVGDGRPRGLEREHKSVNLHLSPVHSTAACSKTWTVSVVQSCSKYPTWEVTLSALTTHRMS